MRIAASTRARAEPIDSGEQQSKDRNRRGSWRRSVLACLACAAGGSLAACTASAADVRPPQDQLFFPTGLAISPDERVLFVTNANSELRYDSGTISVVQLEVATQLIQEWKAYVASVLTAVQGQTTVPAFPSDLASRGCSQDPDHSETLVCGASLFLNNNTAVRIGNFATDIAVQDFSAGGSPHMRVIVPTRGDPSISWADFNGTGLSCNADGQAFELCDDAHRLTTVRNDPELASIPNEPFGVYADSVAGFAVVTHMLDGAISLIDSPANGPAQVVDITANIFGADPLTGISAATGVAGRTQGDGDIVYVGSRTDVRIQTFTIGRVATGAGQQEDAAYLLPGNAFFLNSVGLNASGGANFYDARGLNFSQGGNRLYIVQRQPPTLQIYDTSGSDDAAGDPVGFPRNTPTGASDICREASTVTSLDSGDGELAYVTCFQDGQIYVVDPTGQSQVKDIITVGRGPYAIAAAPGLKELFVTNFLEDTVAVIDVAPDSPLRDRVVLRIGVPRVQ